MYMYMPMGKVQSSAAMRYQNLAVSRVATLDRLEEEHARIRHGQGHQNGTTLSGENDNQGSPVEETSTS